MNTTDALKTLLEQYQRKNSPIRVNFRNLVPSDTNSDFYSHLIHPYPAKLLPQIPRFFLSNDLLSKEGDIVLDLFAGAGTVLLEALLARRRVVGAECNPIARLITSAKLTYIDEETLQRHLQEIIEKRDSLKDAVLCNFKNIAFWYSKSSIENLSVLKLLIESIEDEKIRVFFTVCFSNCLKKVSYANPDFSVPVKLKESNYAHNPQRHRRVHNRLEKLYNIDVFEVFNTVVKRNIQRISSLKNLQNISFELYRDARNLSNQQNTLKDNSIQLIITSPPYAGAQKYTRAVSLSLWWLGYCQNSLKQIKDKEIGREDYLGKDYHTPVSTGIKAADELLSIIREDNPLRAHIAANYLNEMRIALKEGIRVLKPNGFMIIVVGNNKICKHDFVTSQYLEQIANESGLKTILNVVDDITSRGLMITRNKTASIINSETVLVLQKQ
ncbi:MAG: DNA methyltransferase [Victivallaceae bacterium]